MIEYIHKNGNPNSNCKVKLDGRVIGEIKSVPMPNSKTLEFGWCYFPKGWKVGGEILNPFGIAKNHLGSLK